MNKSVLRSITLGLVVALASLPLYAQTATSASNESDKTVAKVQTDGGVIMISEGATEFQTAIPDQRVKAKTRLMVSEESSATVVYDNGCDKKYDKPGVYEISSTCVLPYLVGGASRAWSPPVCWSAEQSSLQSSLTTTGIRVLRSAADTNLRVTVSRQGRP